MKNRLMKRHKRQVSRAKERVRVSEPDLRTHEQIQAARDASRPPVVGRDATLPRGAATSLRAMRPAGTGGAAKTDA